MFQANEKRFSFTSRPTLRGEFREYSMTEFQALLERKGVLTIKKYRYEKFNGGWATAFDFNFHHENGEWWSAIGELNESILEEWASKA